MSNQNSIIEKIAKLLALGKSPNENEAMAAIAKAQRLMSKYSIDQSTVENLQNGVNSQGFIKQQVSMNHSRFKMWEKHLMMIIAEANFCEVVFYIGTDIVEIYGTEYDSEMVVALYAYIREQMIKLANIAYRQAFSAINGNVWKTSYFNGMNAKIRKLIKETQKQIATEENGTAIVLVKQELVKEFYEENKGKVITKKSTYRKIDGAYEKGYRDGDKVVLG